ncbi:hypothetical protein ACFL03_14440 [Thermodesulfobacteriota bacterium]
MALVHETAGPEADMANDISALYNAGQSLKTVVQVIGIKTCSADFSTTAWFLRKKPIPQPSMFFLARIAKSGIDLGAE